MCSGLQAGWHIRDDSNNCLSCRNKKTASIWWCGCEYAFSWIIHWATSVWRFSHSITDTVLTTLKWTYCSTTFLFSCSDSASSCITGYFAWSSFYYLHWSSVCGYSFSLKSRPTYTHSWLGFFALPTSSTTFLYWKTLSNYCWERWSTWRKEESQICLYQGLGCLKPDGSDSLIPTSRMPYGLGQYIIEFFTIHHELIKMVLLAL